MNNSIKVLNNLYKEASVGNFQNIKSIIDKNKFSQQEMDEAFRQCIHNYNKIEKDSFENCIELFLKNIQEINFRNPRYNNTTILMYSIDESQDTATQLIISHCKENLNMNLTDFNGENIIFHLVNNDNFSTEEKKTIIKNFVLNDYNLYSKNNRNETIPSILKSKGCFDLLEDIQNVIKEYKFDQNKLTSLYNNKKYEELLEVIEKYEKNESNDKQNIIINSYSINYNKLLILINTLNLKNKSYYDNYQNQPIKFFLEIQEISHYTCLLMDVLKKVVFDPKGGNNQFSLCLIINKMIMYYQLDLYKDFCLLKNDIEDSENIYLNNNLYFNLYKYFINIDMMMQRGLYLEAKNELNILENNIK